MKRAIVGLVALFWVVLMVGQGVGQESPADKVCLSREAALKAIADGDLVKSQAVELAVKDKAIADLKELLGNVRVEFARVSGENSILKQRAVSDAALIELLSKMVRPKRIGLVNLF